MKSFKIQINKKWLKINSLSLMYSAIISLFIVFVCSFSNANFFFLDDAQNDYIGYFGKIGKMWLNGEIPFIVKDSIIGQNQLIDLHRSIFLPQNIIVSILFSLTSSYFLVSRILAFMNLWIISFFSQKLGKVLLDKEKFSWILSFLFCINPIFLYVYQASWWSGASSQAWFVVALTSIFLLRKRFCVKYLFLNVFSVLLLLASGWVHSIIAYAVVVIFMLFEYLKDKEYHKIIIFILISIGIIFIGINFYSEYIISSKLLNREVGIGNVGNFLSPSFNQIIITFNPVYNHFMNRFGGYMMTYVPIGYSSIFILFLVCFSKNFIGLFNNKNIKFMFKLSITFFVLSQTPTQFNPIQFPFRFLPYLSEMLILFSMYGISISKLEYSKTRQKVFIIILILSSLLAFFAVEEKNDYFKVFKVNVVFVILSISYLYTVAKNKEFKFIHSILYYALMLLLMLFLQSESFLSSPNIRKTVNLKNKFDRNGYFLSLTNGNEDKINIEDLNSSQFLLFDIKSINGYSPVGNKKLKELLDTYWSHHFFHEEGTINNLSKKFDNVCYFDLMNIDSIAIKKEKLTEEMKNKLIGCGYNGKTVENPEVLYYIKDQKNIGNVSYVSNGISVNKQTADRANLEKYQISSTSNGFMVLSKPYWRGYRAYVNSKKVNVSDEKGLLKLDNIPKGLNNATLEIKYFPASWRITLWLGLLGIVEIITVLVYFDKTKDFD